MFFPETENPIIKFTWNLQRSQIAKIVMKKKNKVGDLTLPDFKTYLKANQSNQNSAIMT